MRLSARRRAAMIAAGALAVAGIAVPVGSAYAATACDVVYATNDWHRRVHRQRHHPQPRRPHQRLDAAVRLPRRPARHAGLVGQLEPERRHRHGDEHAVERLDPERRPDQHRLQRQLDRQQPQAHRVLDQRRHVRRRTAAATAHCGRSRCRPARSRRPPTSRSAPPRATPTARSPRSSSTATACWSTPTPARRTRTRMEDLPAGSLHRAGAGVRQREPHRDRRGGLHRQSRDRPGARRVTRPSVSRRRGRHRRRSTSRLQRRADRAGRRRPGPHRRHRRHRRADRA